MWQQNYSGQRGMKVLVNYYGWNKVCHFIACVLFILSAYWIMNKFQFSILIYLLKFDYMSLQFFQRLFLGLKNTYSTFQSPQNHCFTTVNFHLIGPFIFSSLCIHKNFTYLCTLKTPSERVIIFVFNQTYSNELRRRIS